MTYNIHYNEAIIDVHKHTFIHAQNMYKHVYNYSLGICSVKLVSLHHFLCSLPLLFRLIVCSQVFAPFSILCDDSGTKF